MDVFDLLLVLYPLYQSLSALNASNADPTQSVTMLQHLTAFWALWILLQTINMVFFGISKILGWIPLWGLVRLVFQTISSVLILAAYSPQVTQWLSQHYLQLTNPELIDLYENSTVFAHLQGWFKLAQPKLICILGFCRQTFMNLTTIATRD